MNEKENSGWYCLKCNAWVDGLQVTYDEHHETCGCLVLTFNPHDEIAKLRAVNAKLVEAVERLSRKVKSQAVYSEMYDHNICKDTEAAKAALAEAKELE